MAAGAEAVARAHVIRRAARTLVFDDDVFASFVGSWCVAVMSNEIG
jgi:hypothetical protein